MLFCRLPMTWFLHSMISLDGLAVTSFIWNYFAMLEFVITFVKNQSSDAPSQSFMEQCFSLASSDIMM